MMHSARAYRHAHLTPPLAGLVACLGIAVMPGGARAERLPLALLARGGSTLTVLRAQQLPLSPDRPAGVKRVPKGIAAPYFTTIQLGPKESPSRFTVLVDAPEGKPSRLFIDANGNGDFLDDPAPEWTHKTYAGHESPNLLESVGAVTLPVRYGAVTVPMRVTLRRYDTSEPARTAQFLPLYLTADYAREGTVSLTGKPYRVWLVDALSRGDFRGSGVPGQNGIFLLIDVNGNGKIDPRGETYDVAKPFNIGGTTYEIRNLDAAGAGIDVVRSAQQVAEILPPPDLSIGKAAPAFDVKDTGGNAVRFPGDYKGKLVLVYFWATWCGDCNREVPYVSMAFRQLHSKGLEILGISLDHPDQGVQLAAYTHGHAMDWPEIYDGKVWDASIAQLYYVHSTPTALLVEGGTGKIIAAGSDLMGDRLAPTIQRALNVR
jgi:thiol-disulfide isomerase/thioredoxin